jgi:CHAT domain-containing protein
VRLRNKPKTEKFDTAQLALLPRLPDTRAEILDVAQAMRADVSQDVFLGERATVQAVKTASLVNRKVIHFATHGLVPGELDGLTQPALAMTTPDLPGTGGGDGLLKLEDILGLKLNADWVVLSACNTASADGGSAEAVSGLGRAFFFAGARALLVSNWPVDSASARKLMTDVFRRQAADAKIDRAEALRQAMLQLIDSGARQDSKDQPLYSYAHPLFWAPFSLVGDGGGR